MYLNENFQTTAVLQQERKKGSSRWGESYLVFERTLRCLFPCLISQAWPFNEDALEQTEVIFTLQLGVEVHSEKSRQEDTERPPIVQSFQKVKSCCCKNNDQTTESNVFEARRFNNNSRWSPSSSPVSHQQVWLALRVVDPWKKCWNWIVKTKKEIAEDVWKWGIYGVLK